MPCSHSSLVRSLKLRLLQQGNCQAREGTQRQETRPPNVHKKEAEVSEKGQQTKEEAEDPRKRGVLSAELVVNTGWWMRRKRRDVLLSRKSAGKERSAQGKAVKEERGCGWVHGRAPHGEGCTSTTKSSSDAWSEVRTNRDSLFRLSLNR